MLLAEVALFAVGGPIAATEAEAGLPVPDQVAHLVRRAGEWAYDSEPPLRTLLRLSLDASAGVRRPGHRVAWIADVLAPIRDELATETYERLADPLALFIGIDPVVVMTDIAGATREQALDTLEWPARALVESALAEKR
jgi:hypothetical protein